MGTLIAASILVPATAASLTIGARRRPNVREAITLAAAGSLLAVASVLTAAVLRGEQPALEVFSVAEGVSLAFRVDALGALFAVMASFLWLVTSVYAIGYLRGNAEARQTAFYTCFALCLTTVMGLAFAANLVTFLVFFELLTIATYPLVVHKATPRALAAGRRYLAYLVGGGAALLVGVAVTQSRTGSGTFTPGGFVDDALAPATQVGVLVLLVLGFGSKAAIIPLHRWLPSAMVAPTPVSALLHAVAVVKAGVFGIARTVGYVFGPEALAELGVVVVVSAVAAITIVVASSIALFQDNLKARLAYSTIAHLSYIVLGLTLLTGTGWTGGLFHIVNHAALKITLFFCAGALYVHARVERVRDLDGIGRRMPVTMSAFAIAAVGLVGLPPMGGFVSKWYLVLGSADAHQVVFTAVMVLGGVLTAGYLFPIVARAFLRAPPPSTSSTEGPAPAASRPGEAPLLLVGPLVATAAVALLFGLGQSFALFELVQRSTGAVMGVVP